MKHLAAIQKQFSITGVSNDVIRIAVESDWWKKLSPEEQRQYILQHRQTRLRPTTGQPVNITKTVLSSLPKDWKKKVIYAGGGENSQVEQLPDMLRAKVLRDKFKDGDTKIIVGFKAGGNMARMEPAFVITENTYGKTPKFNISATIDAQGNSIPPTDLYDKKRRYSRRRGSWEERIRELRMSNVVDKLPDIPYTVYAVKPDPKRQKLRQQRTDMEPGSTNISHKGLENKMIAEAVKPAYDYYSARLQQGLDQLRDSAVPSFDDVLSSERQSDVDVNRLIDGIKHDKDKIRSLSSAIGSIWHHLPSGEKSYSDDWRSRDAKRFLEDIKSLKERFKDDIALATKMKLKNALQSLRTNDVLDAVDQLNDIKRPDLASEALALRSLAQGTDEHTEKMNELNTKILTAQYAQD